MRGGDALIDVRPYGPALGAEVRGVNLADGLTERDYRDVRAAFLQHGVLFFKDQAAMAPDTQVAVGQMFGALHIHPAAPHLDGHPAVFVIHAHKDSKIANGEFWHSDVSCDEVPPLGTMLEIHTLPDVGGDTLFANMYMAFDTLSAPLQRMLDGLTARHESEHVYRGRYSDRGVDDAGKVYPSAVHPVVRTHPETGKKALYVNRTFTRRITELSEAESDALLGFLFTHAEQIDFQIRFRWSRNDVAFWDNRCTMHHAVWDYWPHERKGHRVTIKGDRPR